MNNFEDNVTNPPSEILDYVKQLKSNGTFDQFRRDCLADIDTKEQFQNLKKKVEGFVKNYLFELKWNPSLKKSDLRENLRKKIHENGIVNNGLNKIVEQVVNPKIDSSFRPIVEKLINEPDSFDYSQSQPLFKSLKIQQSTSSTPLTTSSTNILAKSISQPEIKPTTVTTPSTATKNINTTPVTFSLDDSYSNLTDIKQEETSNDKQQQQPQLEIKTESLEIKVKIENEPDNQQLNQNLVNKEEIKEETQNQQTLLMKSETNVQVDNFEKSVNEEKDKIKKLKVVDDKNDVLKVKKIIKKKTDGSNQSEKPSTAAPKTTTTATVSKTKIIKKSSSSLIVKKPPQTNINPKIVVLDNQTLKNDPKKEYHFDWKLDVLDETNTAFIDELSASSVHTSDLSDFDEFDQMDLNENENSNSLSCNNFDSMQNNTDKNSKKNDKIKNNNNNRSKNKNLNDNDRSRNTARRKRSLNPKYYSHEFTQDYRNLSKSRSRSRSSSKSRNNSTTR